MNEISVKENINITKKNIDHIYKITNGDLRSGINLLEKFKFNTNIDICNKSINKIVIDYINFSRNFNKQHIINYINEILNNGYNAHEIIINIIYNIDQIDFDDDIKYKILIELSDLDCNLNNGSNDYIILIYLSNFIHNI